MTTTLPFQAQQPIFGKVGGISELVHMSEEERLKYNVSLDTYRTNLSVMKNERAEGRAEGIEEGIGIGEKKSKCDIAINLKKMGMSIDQIADATGLTVEEISAL